METQTILAECEKLGVQLRLDGADGLIASPRSRVTPELAAALRENKAAIIVALAPLPDLRFELERALCACGRAPYRFDAAGAARCLAHVGGR